MSALSLQAGAECGYLFFILSSPRITPAFSLGLDALVLTFSALGLRASRLERACDLAMGYSNRLERDSRIVPKDLRPTDALRCAWRDANMGSIGVNVRVGCCHVSPP